VAWKLYDGRAPLVCCGEPMSELAPNTTDAAQEKHVPVVTRADGRLTVTVGSVTHPMEEKHFIGFVAVLSGAQVSLRFLSPGDTPSFTLSDEHCDAVYAWCNLHGLWKAQL
jgi:superoxide reductase